MGPLLQVQTLNNRLNANKCTGFNAVKTLNGLGEAACLHTGPADRTNQRS